MDHAAMGHDMAAMPGMSMSMAMGQTGYAAGSGTSRLPANEGMMRGVMLHPGDWMLMLHGYVWGAYTDQGGPRGDNMAVVQSMGMITAQRPLGDGARLQLQTMLSLEPLMGARGYPNLFATGEAANGRPLIDRQHPHDLFMELSARVDVDIARDTSLFLYAGPVGEPALGPSAFMHRKSAQYQPLSPITHHWFDSTHITYGVVTAGIAAPTFQLEASAFRGREPDERRWGIETPRLDSWSVRGTWTPSPAWAVQASYGWLKSPEELEPEGNERRTTASVNYATGALTTTFAFSNKDKGPGRTLTAWLGEVNYDLSARHSVFGRVENVANDELFPDDDDPLHHQRFRVTKLEGGYAYRMPIAGPVGLAVGGAVGTYVLPAALDAAYGKVPVSFTLFAKLMLGQ
ncbi:hypothetical protein ACFOKI_10375 [Sphingomonas qilianensis]|uniref:Alginate export domain-containing protein n=1 Tax=Sphingomonas qilianensis TaxID=1736690 RepID=A0ABU9XPV7_9SPHN